MLLFVCLLNLILFWVLGRLLELIWTFGRRQILVDLFVNLQFLPISSQLHSILWASRFSSCL